ncbi:MAG: DUF1822 family protein [Xenococcaceae cyanobacterium MO_188.B19]|nr:DUF1822 family protein [Xenococcaceae cyanobacterium MO_188.B19]
MKLNIEQLQSSFPENIWLNLPAINTVENISKNMVFTNSTAYNNAQINDLCLTVVLDWIKNNLGLDKSEVKLRQVEDIASIWDAITGSNITIGKTKIILIPTEILDTEEFVVPQEWIDIPNLVGSYYLPIQVDWDNQLIRIWGYASHNIFKNKAEYDPIYRTYSLARDYIISDLETLWLAIELGLQEIADIPSIMDLSTGKVEQVLEKVSNPSPYSPRLELSFTEWSGLFGNPSLRQELYQKRLASAVDTNSLVSVANSKINTTNIYEQKAIKTKIVDLTKWLSDQFTESIELGWQTLDSFIFNTEINLAYRNNFSSGSNRDNSIQRGKLIKLQMQVDTAEFILLVAVTPEAEDEVKVLIQLHPNSDHKFLPSGVTMSLFSEGNTIGNPIISQGDDIYLQSLPLHCSRNTDFKVKISFRKASLIEEFTIT